MLDRHSVHPADSQIQIDAAEYVEAWRRLACEIRQARGRVVVILEDDAAHPAGAGLTRGLEAIDRARHVVRMRVDVDIDGAREEPLTLGLPRPLAARTSQDRGQQQRETDRGGHSKQISTRSRHRVLLCTTV